MEGSIVSNQASDANGAPMWTKGMKLLALDVRNIWCDAVAIGHRGNDYGREVKVHYLGWNKRWDEWILERSSRLRCRDNSEGTAAPPTRTYAVPALCPQGMNDAELEAHVADARAKAAAKAEIARKAVAEAAEAARAAKVARARAIEAAAVVRAAAAGSADSTDWSCAVPASSAICDSRADDAYGHGSITITAGKRLRTD